MKIGSLFSGYGGLEEGIRSVLDAETAWVSDIDKGANKVLAYRYPNVPNIGDISVVDWSTVEPVDIICGGSPCQDVSHAGARKGMREGTRSNLWVSMREAVATIRPRLVVWENVRGAYSADADSEVEPCPGCVGDGSGRHLRALGRVLGDLADLGYDARWYGLRAADVGAPHGRFRVFLLAHPSCDEGWEFDGNGRAATDPRGEHGQQRRIAASGQAEGRRSLGELAGRDRATVALLPTPAVNDMGEGKTVEAWDDWTAKMKAKHGNGNGHGPSLSIEAQRLLPTPSVADVEGGRKHRSGARSDELLLNGIAASERWGKYADAIARWEHLTRPAPAPTEPGRNGKPLLSAAFTEWLMGLPDGWITEVPDITRNEALKLCGNGVVPQQCAAALRLLLSLEVAA